MMKIKNNQCKRSKELKEQVENNLKQMLKWDQNPNISAIIFNLIVYIV